MVKKLHPLLTKPVKIKDAVRGLEKPTQLIEEIAEKPTVLQKLAGFHIVSARQFTKEIVVQLCRLAAEYELLPELPYKPLAGKILISAFYEPSTRTRLSFESAWHRLGGDIMSITDPKSTGMAKGESYEDIAEMFNNYGDVVVIRDSNEEAIYRMLESLRIPIINAGNGIDEHPTQALADIYAILKWNPKLIYNNLSDDKKVIVGIIGNPSKMRTVRSLLILLSLFSDSIKKVYIISPEKQIFDEGQKEELEEQGLQIEVTNNPDDVLSEIDIIYINSIAWVGDTYETLTGDFELNLKSPLKENAIILHPLARGKELNPELDHTKHNWYFAQARGAVFIRMALLTCINKRISYVTEI